MRQLIPIVSLLSMLAAEPAVAQMPNRVGPPVKTAKRKAPMTPAAVDSSSPSTIIRATHILLIRIDSGKPSAWVEGDQGPHRTVDLSVRIEDILKGALRESKGSVLSLKIEQTGSAGTRIYALPGVWSDHPVEPGTRLVAFSSGSGGRAADLLTEPSLETLLSAEEALPDVHLAIEGENGLPLHNLITQAQSASPTLHYTFAEYLTAKLSPSLLSSRENFQLLAQLVQDPGLSPAVRSTLISNINSDMLAQDPAPAPFVSIWTSTLFHVAGMPQAESLRDNILKVFLPNLLGIVGGAQKKRAADIFRDSPRERERAEHILATRSGASSEALSHWLRD